MTTGSTVETQPLEDRLIESSVAGLEIMTIYLGRKLGLYEALSSPRTVDGLAEKAGIDRRYAREWLEQQTTAGILEVDDESARPDVRVFSLPNRHRDVLVDPESPYQVGPLAGMLVGVAQVVDDVAAAYRSGGGVAYADYGPTFRDGQGGINRPAFVHDLVESWLAGSVPDLVGRLNAGGRVADLGCGVGWSTIAVAKGFPSATVIGYDSDAASIADAVDNAREAGVGPEFRTADGGSLTEDGPFDLVVILEALHDMADPAGVLRQARSALAEGGAVVVADEKVGEEFHAHGDVLERMMYGWSVLHCLPAARAEEDSAALGTVLREGVLRQLALSAGYSRVETPDVDAGFFRLYVLSN